MLTSLAVFSVDRSRGGMSRRGLTLCNVSTGWRFDAGMMLRGCPLWQTILIQMTSECASALTFEAKIVLTIEGLSSFVETNEGK